MGFNSGFKELMPAVNAST